MLMGGTLKDVRCEKDGLVFLINIGGVPSVPGTKPIFDKLSKMSGRRASAPTIDLPVPGHRTFAERFEIEGNLVQRLLVEINRNKVVTFTVGSDPEKKPNLEYQRLTIDRFFASLKVRS